MKKVQVRFKAEFGLFIARLSPANKIISQDENFVVVEMPDDNWADCLARMGGDFATRGGQPVPPTPPGPVLDYSGYTKIFADVITIPGEDDGYGYGGNSTYIQLYDAIIRNTSVIDTQMFALQEQGIEFTSYWENGAMQYSWSTASYYTTLDNISDPEGKVTSIEQYALAFANAGNGIISFPNCEYVGDYAFAYMNRIMASLTYDYTQFNPLVFNLPNCKSLGSLVFGGASGIFIKELHLDSLENWGNNDIMILNFYEQMPISKFSFSMSIYFLSDKVVSTDNSQPFSVSYMGTPPSWGLFVPESLVADYKNHSVWGQYSNNIFPYIGG